MNFIEMVGAELGLGVLGGLIVIGRIAETLSGFLTKRRKGDQDKPQSQP